MGSIWEVVDEVFTWSSGEFDFIKFIELLTQSSEESVQDLVDFAKQVFLFKQAPGFDVSDKWYWVKKFLAAFSFSSPAGKGPTLDLVSQYGYSIKSVIGLEGDELEFQKRVNILVLNLMEQVPRRIAAMELVQELWDNGLAHKHPVYFSELVTQFVK